MKSGSRKVCAVLGLGLAGAAVLNRGRLGDFAENSIGGPVSELIHEEYERITGKNHTNISVSKAKPSFSVTTIDKEPLIAQTAVRFRLGEQRAVAFWGQHGVNSSDVVLELLINPTDTASCVDEFGHETIVHADDPNIGPYAVMGFYCYGNKAVLIDTRTLIDNPVTGSGADHLIPQAVADYIASHEMGHHWQSVKKDSDASVKKVLKDNKTTELQADCLAGYSMQSATPADVQAVIAVALQMGEKNHGTGEQREDAYRFGQAGNDCRQTSSYIKK